MPERVWPYLATSDGICDQTPLSAGAIYLSAALSSMLVHRNKASSTFSRRVPKRRALPRFGPRWYPGVLAWPGASWSLNNCARGHYWIILDINLHFMGRTLYPFGAIKALKKLLQFFWPAMQMSLRMRSNYFFFLAPTEGRPQEKQQYKKSVPCAYQRAAHLLAFCHSHRPSQACVIQNANNPARGDCKSCESELIYTANNTAVRCMRVGWFVFSLLKVTSPIDLFIWLCRLVRKILIVRDCNWWRREREFNRANSSNRKLRLKWFTSAMCWTQKQSVIIFAHRQLADWKRVDFTAGSCALTLADGSNIYLRLLIKFEVVVGFINEPSLREKVSRLNIFPPPECSARLSFHRESNWFGNIFIYRISDETVDGLIN